MRDLLRTRKQLVRERSSHIQRLQKTLEDANIKLDSVITDIIGLSGRAMIEAMIAGETDPERLAALAHRRIKASPEELREALRGRVTRHHRFLLRLHLQQIDAIDAAIDEIDQEVDAQHRALSHRDPTLEHHSRRQRLERLRHPCRNRRRHEPLPDRRTPDLLGRPLPEERRERRQARSTRMRKGAPWLKTTLVQCAWAAARTKGSYFQAQFHRLRARRGAKKAIGAVAASILTAAYHMLKDGTLYQDLGPDHFDKRGKGRQVHRLINRLQNLGFTVEITPVQAAA